MAEIVENSRQLQERQLAVMAELSEQFERAMELRLNAVLERFDERLQRALDQDSAPQVPDQNGHGQATVMQPPRAATPSGVAEGSKGFWQRYGLA